MTRSPNVPRANMANALPVYCPNWGAGRVTGLTSDLRPIVAFDSGAIRSRSWETLTFGEGRAW